MITKAYVESIINNDKAIVRMPLFNKIKDVNGATPQNELPTALVSIVPGSKYFLEVGDIVFVGFEEDDMSKPVILGMLSRPSQKESKIDLNLLNLTVDETANLPSNTTIGDVKPHSINCLFGLEENQNIRDKFTSIDIEIKNIKDKINNLQQQMEIIMKNIGT